MQNSSVLKKLCQVVKNSVRHIFKKCGDGSRITFEKSFLINQYENKFRTNINTPPLISRSNFNDHSYLGKSSFFKHTPQDLSTDRLLRVSNITNKVRKLENRSFSTSNKLLTNINNDCEQVQKKDTKNPDCPAETIFQNTKMSNELFFNENNCEKLKFSCAYKDVKPTNEQKDEKNSKSNENGKSATSSASNHNVYNKNISNPVDTKYQFNPYIFKQIKLKNECVSQTEGICPDAYHMKETPCNKTLCPYESYSECTKPPTKEKHLTDCEFCPSPTINLSIHRSMECPEITLRMKRFAETKVENQVFK